MNINVKLELPEPINKALSPVCQSIGNTLAYAWDGAFAHLTLWSKKRIFKFEHDFSAYKQSVETHIGAIPQEDLKEPRLSLVGPAIEASKYYIEEPVIREMFAKLIAADVDKRKEGLVHHSYVDIIKQMSPMDARILKEFQNPTHLARCLVAQKNPPNTSLVFSDIYLSDTISEYNEEVSISISNLDRLGLIDIPTRNLNGIIIDGSNEEMLHRFQTTALYKELSSLSSDFTTNYESFEVRTYLAYLTQLGNSFRYICL